MKKMFLLFSLTMAFTANATEFICSSPKLKAGKSVEVYYINTSSKVLKHFVLQEKGYALFRLISPVKAETSYYETFPGQTIINLTKGGYSSYLIKYDNEKNFSFTDEYAEHKDFICKSKN